MPTKLPIDKLRDRVKDYLGQNSVQEIDPDRPTALVKAPVEVGHNTFIRVDDIPDLNNIPFIPERMRDFAFRYATEYKPNAEWAKEYGVGPVTIGTWLRNEGVKSYIALVRYEQRMYNLAQHTNMQRNVYKTINKILSDVNITADTIGPIVSMAKFVYQILHNPSDASDRAKGALNVNIGFGQNSPVTERDTSNPYAQERNVTPKELDKLQADIEELEILEDALREKEGVGDE